MGNKDNLLKKLYAFVKEKIRRFFHVLYYRHLFSPHVTLGKSFRALKAYLFYGRPFSEDDNPFFKKDYLSWSHGKRARELRKYKMMSIGEMCVALGIDENMLQDIEEGNKKYTPELHRFYTEIARVLDVHPHEITLPSRMGDQSPPIKNYADYLKECAAEAEKKNGKEIVC